jgi:hypothetical protein
MGPPTRGSASRLSLLFVCTFFFCAALWPGSLDLFALGELAGHAQDAATAGQQRGRQREIPPDEEEPTEEAPVEDQSDLLKATTAGARAEIEKAVSGVNAQDPKALARALHVALATDNSVGDDFVGPSLEPVGDLDGDGNLEYVYRWTGRMEAATAQTAASGEGIWDLFLLAWDGKRWRRSELLAGEGLYDLHPLPQLGESPGLAVLEGLGQVPYPVVFKYQDHAAVLAWDSRSEESRYQGFSAGEVEFRDPGSGAPLEMLVAGKADPGLVHFPRSGNRGFEIATLYTWDGKAFVPRKTVYSPGEDFTFYRFVSALHLKDFRSAYGLIDAPKFLKSKDADLASFRKYIESTYPEFLGDNLFEVPDASPETRSKNGFELNLQDHLYVYHPAYSNDGKFLLTGLERREVK